MKKILTFFWKKKWKILESLFLIFCIPFLFINISTWNNISDHSEISNLSAESVAIVFGAAAWGDLPSDVFRDRLQVSADLYHAKKIQKILISGDNSEESYNEPQAGKNFLRDQGVLDSDIVLDYAGFRTYDTCARAKQIFGLRRAYLVTQRFHLPRAIFTCNALGVRSTGVSSTLRSYKGDMKNIFRESLAQQKAFYEVLFFPHDPKFLGEIEFIFPEK